MISYLDPGSRHSGPRHSVDWQHPQKNQQNKKKIEKKIETSFFSKLK
jgi:hypothetical protein